MFNFNIYYNYYTCDIESTTNGSTLLKFRDTMDSQRTELNNFTRTIYIKSKSGTWKKESETYTYCSGLEVEHTKEKMERKGLKFNKLETKEE